MAVATIPFYSPDWEERKERATTDVLQRYPCIKSVNARTAFTRTMYNCIAILRLHVERLSSGPCVIRGTLFDDGTVHIRLLVLALVAAHHIAESNQHLGRVDFGQMVGVTVHLDLDIHKEWVLERVKSLLGPATDAKAFEKTIDCQK